MAIKSSTDGSEPVETPSSRSNANALGMVRFTEWAKDKVTAKRKRRGLGEVKPRKKNAWKQMFVNGTALSLATFLVAPLERCRILL